MDMIGIMNGILERDAQAVFDAAERYEGKTAAQAIGEELARASMKGDIKAAAMLMELAGADFRSRDANEKHELDRQKLNLSAAPQAAVVLEDARPENS